jgi:hypothetical protein
MVVCIPGLLLAYGGSATWILIVTRDTALAAPMVVASFGMTRLLRWSMIWASTPAERKILARQLEREPIVGLIRGWLTRGKGGPPPLA